MRTKDIISKLFRSNKITGKILGLISIGRKNYYLDKVGWIKSFKNDVPVDNSGNPIPWFTYSIIHFLDERVDKNMTVFEYGSGNSTIWWNKRVSKVIACEHSTKWYKNIKKEISNNVTYMLSKQHDVEYPKMIKKCEKNIDILVIDGKKRVDCAKVGSKYLTDRGVIIWDDTHRKDYEKGISFLSNKGFKKITFRGLKPTNSWMSETSIFYREDNCLTI